MVVLGTCKLCLRKTKLLNSHIYPNFFFKRSIYDGESNYLCIPQSKEKRVTREQGGFKDRLLCIDCEQKFSSYEKYASQLIFGDKLADVRILRDAKISTLLTGIKYKEFKLFQMSLLWRCAATKIGHFKHVTLGPYKEELRQMLLEGDPGTNTNYGCAMSLLLLQGEVFNLMRTPEKIKSEFHTTYRIIAGGLIWMFYVGNRKVPERVSKYFLQSEGLLYFLKCDALTLPFLRYGMMQMANRQKDVEKTLGKK